ncbi:MAG: hypothetical protein H7210_00640 [Pyrinomonadaceae bacterium]|nr:hypothetical protein [Phycisphaerales bacterium]
MSGHSRVTLLCTLAILGVAGTSQARPGPDVIVGDLPDVSNYTSGGAIGGIRAYSVGTTSCNLGDQELIWTANTNQHPVISQNLYRLANGRFEQIGQAWLKHGFCALQGTVCSNGCQPSPLGCGALGILCSDPYSSGLNGDQGGLGPKFQVNASTGGFPYPFQGQGTTGNAIFKRLQARDTDVNPAVNPGALYFVSSMYVQPQDALANNDNNNESYRRVTFAAGNRNISLTASTQREKPGIQAWKDNDASVTITNVDVPGDGRFIIASKATDLGGGTWHYEYAVQNLNSDRSGQSFSIPTPVGAVITNVGFKDVDYHSGEPYALTDWTSAAVPTSVSWATQTFAQNANANALRWDTIYNFRFDANVAPGTGSATIGLFKAGVPATAAGLAVIPGGGPPPAPVNDLCANASSIGNGVTPFSTALATSDAPTQSGCETSTTFFNDIWYTYSTPCSGNVTVNLCGASFDTKLAVYTSCPLANNTAIACNDDNNACGANSLQSSLTFAATAGTQYIFRVGAFVNGATGSGNITVAGPTCGPVPPANDNCANATTVSTGATNYDSTNATTDGPDEPTNCNFFGDTQISADVWFRYTTGNCGGAYTISLCGSGYDTEIGVYNNSCPTNANTVLACNDDQCALQSQVAPTLAANTTYLIRVGGYQGATGAGTLTITAPVCGPANDNCAAPAAITSYGETVFSNAGANNDGPAACASFGSDVWFTYTACVSGSHTLNTCAAATFDTVLLVYTGDCGALAQVACNDDTAGCGANDLSSSITWNATAGTTYRFRAGGFNGAQGTATLTLSGPACLPPGPANDNCNNRAGIALGATPFVTTGATTDGPAHAACDNAGSNQVTNDIWYNYPSSCNGVLTVDTCSDTNYDSKVAVYAYDGTCATISDATLVACNDDACGGSGLASRVSIPVQAGQNYAIRVGGYNGATGAGTLTLACVACPCDWNSSGTLTSQDFFDFIAAFFNDNADYNNDGQTSSQDFFDFLQCFLAPPNGCPA